MSLFRVLVEGFTEGFLTAASHQARALGQGDGAAERGRIERLCRELGWGVDEREGAVIYLHFGNRAGALRKVRIGGGDDACVTLSAHSFARLRGESVPADVLAYLLRRNVSGSGLGTWGTYSDDEDNVTFHLIYQALGAGLDAEAFKHVCESLVNEVEDFDDKMRQARLLR